MKKLGILLGALILGLAVWKGGDITKPANIWAFPYTAGQSINTNQNISGSTWLKKVLTFEGSTTDTWVANLQVVDPTQTNTITIPNTSGILILGTGTAGKMTKWTGTAAIGDATDDDTGVHSAVTLKHTQGTDQGLDTGGANEVTATNAKDAVTKKHAHTGTANYIPKWNGTAYVDSTIFDSGGGNIRIEATTPGEWVLDVNGGIRSSYFFQAIRITAKGTSNGRYNLYTDSSNPNNRNWVFAAGHTTYGDFVIRQSNVIEGDPWGATGTTRFYISPTGNVGIGTDLPPSRLTVKLSDAAGADSFVIQDSNGVNVATIDSDGVMRTYKGIATVSNGIPSELATVDTTAIAAAIGATTIYTPTASQMFRLSIVLQVKTAATTSSILGGTTGVVITYTEPDGSVAQSIQPLLTSQSGAVIVPATGNTGNATTTQSQGSAIIYAKTGVAIQYAIGYTSVGVTTMTYNVHLKLEAL